MTLINIQKDKECAEFARAAAECFRDHPYCFTYAVGDPKPGCLFAIRWNSFTVMVVRLDDEDLVRLYGSHDLIQQELPKLEPKFSQ